jgi:predicted nucleic acid-binding protein
MSPAWNMRGRHVDVHIPGLCDVEVAAGLRRGMASGAVPPERAAEALRNYLDLRLIRHGHEALMTRILGLRHNFSAYDATYVALAERLGAALLTGDRALARAIRAHTDLSVLT